MSHRFIQLLPGLLSTRSELPFGRYGPTARAFVVQATKGSSSASQNANNFVIYGSSHMSDYTETIHDMGGVRAQFLGHRDEASKFCNVLPAPVWCHALEAKAVRAKGCQVSNTFDDKKHVILQDDDGNEVFTAHHTPGHTDGSTCYLWQNRPEHFSVLFVGDAFGVTSQQGTVGAYLNFHPYAGNLSDEIESLELIQKLRPTYIVPALSMVDDTFVWKFEDLKLPKLLEELRSQQQK